MIYLRQSTASQEVPLGHFVDSTDGVTAETGLTIANTDIKVWKTGATTLADKNSGGATHISGGIYYCTLDATDTNTIGPMVLFVSVSGALAVRLECTVLDEAYYDHLFGTNPPLTPTTAGRTLDVSATGEAGIDWANVGSPTTSVNLSSTSVGTAAAVTTVNGLASGVITATSIASNAITSAKIAADAIGASQIADNAIDAGAIASDAITAAKIADGAIDRATFAADTGMQSIRSNTAQAGASTTITLDASASATTDYYKGCLIYLTGGTGVGQARFCTAYNGTTKVATVGSAWATNPSSGTTFAVLPLDLTTITTAITSVETDTQDIQSRLPASLVSGRIDASVGAMASGVVTATAVATGAIDADALATDAVAEIADGVWDEAISGHLTGGSTGAALNAAGSAGDPWSTPLPGAYSSGTAGKILGDNLNATISSRASQTSLDTVDDFLDTEIAAIKAKTDNLPASPAATGDIPTAGTVADAVWDEALSGHTTSGSAGKSLADTEVDAAAVEVDTQDIQSRLPAALVSGRIDASVGAMASGVLTAAAIASDAITSAKVATGAVDADAIATDAANKIADHILRRNLGNVSTGDTEAFRSILGAIRKLVNKVAVSGSTLTVYKEDDSTSAGTQTVTTSGSASPITALDTN